MKCGAWHSLIIPMASTTRQRERYRCSKCRGRFAIKLKAKRAPRCPHCGERFHVYSIERERRREIARRRRCYCAGYPFPHAAGSLRMCAEHPHFDCEPTFEEIEQYRDCLATKRSGVG